MLIFATLSALLRKATMEITPTKSGHPGLTTALLDLLLPRQCIACGAPVLETLDLCHLCSLTLEPIQDPCPVCAMPGPWGSPCLSCLGRPPPFVATRSAWAYGGQLAVAIQRLKYGGHAHLAPGLARLMGPCLPHHPKVDLSLPVPLHPSRLRWRGYNQAALLLRHIAGALPGRPAWGALRKVRPAPRQVALGREARLINLRGAFKVASPRLVNGARILLLDDVMTTGATATACAEALLLAGAQEVRVLTLARAVP